MGSIVSDAHRKRFADTSRHHWELRRTPEAGCGGCQTIFAISLHPIRSGKRTFARPAAGKYGSAVGRIFRHEIVFRRFSTLYRFATPH